MAAGGFVTGQGGVPAGALWASGRVAFRALSNQVRIVGLLVYREGRTQFAESPFKAVYGLLEPLFFIAIFYTIHEFIMKGVKYGPSMLLFFATGFTPYFIFLSISAGTRGSAREARSLRNFPIVTPLDLLLARSIFEFLAAAPIYALLFCSMWFYGIHEALPYAPDHVVESLLVICTFALGVGMFNAGISTIIPVWKIIYGFAARALMLTSGVHRVAEYLPEYFRKFFVWNPMFHGVEWFRTGFYHLYPTYSLDYGYLFKWAGITFLLGLAFERVARARLTAGRKAAK
ncbi:MAG TPA: ABC transporter permease [Microvirga sp.]|jgi:capsular polysaccharide transport system permease protein|nr:ABC transporter permease [Microvirga sp.]